jgi:hypothetical protein
MDTIMTACQFSAALDLQQVPLREHGHLGDSVLSMPGSDVPANETAYIPR